MEMIFEFILYFLHLGYIHKPNLFIPLSHIKDPFINEADTLPKPYSSANLIRSIQTEPEISHFLFLPKSIQKVPQISHQEEESTKETANADPVIISKPIVAGLSSRPKNYLLREPLASSRKFRMLLK